MLNDLEAHNHVERLIGERDVPAIIEAEIDAAAGEPPLGILYGGWRDIESGNLTANLPESRRPVPVVAS
jgi:hypothetical protein